MVSNRSILVGLMALALVVIAVAIGVALYGGGGSSDAGARVAATPTPSLSAPERAAQDDSPDIPGTFVPSQGRSHFSYAYSLGQTPTPFCAGVPQAQPAAPPQAAATPATSPPTDCYASNPPSSGRHLNVQRNVDAGGGNLINIPPDPDVYPPDVEVPRDAIPHILEHAGVFVGYNCALGNTACDAVVKQIIEIVNDEIDNHGSRVVMAHDSDLPPDTVGMSSWTRVLDFAYDRFNEALVRDFIETNSCRVDWEGFCR